MSHIESPPPAGLPNQLKQFKDALQNAKNRLAWLTGHSPNNALAIRGQHKIIAQYERQISELEDTWLT
jgi:outer membrane protein TolC